MLTLLCCNRNVQHILFFLFVNGKCYGTQLHRLLKMPLTPLQKTLIRLEKNGVLMSYLEGKTRLYQFNPAFSLLPELEQLLKKAYTLLPPQHKKDYYAQEESSFRQTSSENKHRTLLAFWEKLATVTQVTFQAKTQAKEDSGWNGKGKGEVTVTKEGLNTLIFTEKGSWQNQQGEMINFSNAFRWTLDRQACLISLEHLRRGVERAVFLFYLTPSSSQTLSSVDSHLCGGDIYFGSIQFDSHHLKLNWRVIGPKKNEDIHYYYS